jgi:hypothetical protein
MALDRDKQVALQVDDASSISLGVVANSDVPTLAESRGLTWLVAALVALQLLDGALTFTGMQTFGLQAEGNPLLRVLMESLGLIPALIITKGACIGIVVALYKHVTHVRWLGGALAGIAAVYTLTAILPWSFLLISEYLG